MHENNNFGFIQLYENIRQSSRAIILPSDQSKLKVNQSKNRYQDVLSCMISHFRDQNFIFLEFLDDHSRVKLSTNEYINANYIDVNYFLKIEV